MLAIKLKNVEQGESAWIKVTQDIKMVEEMHEHVERLKDHVS